jgi:prepilin-type N-terminal cleavage/methylation domain-containing protein
MQSAECKMQNAECRMQNTQRRAFTLVELLVAIGIAAVLITLVVGVIAKVKQAAYRSTTAATIAALQGAVEQYYQNFKAYPGPVSDEAVCGLDNSGLPIGVQRVSMSENLVLGLVGGLGFNSGGQVIFAKEFVGKGPRTLGSGAASKVMAPFYGANDRITSYALAPTNPAWGLVIGNNQQPLNTDSAIPEFLDSFPETMPILYYRAHRSAPGVASDGGSGGVLAQYDVRQNLVYLNVRMGMATPQAGHGHGLLTADVYTPPGNRGPNYRYNLTTFMASPNDPTRPRVPDGYVLISAGADRIYGTDDDVVSFGKVAP